MASPTVSARPAGEPPVGLGVHPSLTVPPDPFVGAVKSALIQLLAPVVLPTVQGSKFLAVVLLLPPLVSLFPLLNIFMILATWAQVFSVILDHWLPAVAEPLLCNPLKSIFANALLLPSGAVL